MKKTETTQKQAAFARLLDELHVQHIPTPLFRQRHDISSQNWQNWKRRGMPPSHCDWVAVALGINVEWLITGNGNRYPDTAETDVGPLVINQRKLIIKQQDYINRLLTIIASMSDSQVQMVEIQEEWGDKKKRPHLSLASQ